MTRITAQGAILLFGTLLCFSTFAQTGKSFPGLVGTTLTDQEINLPVDTKGKFTLLGLAYSKKAEDDLVTWYEPVYNTFINKSSTPSLFDFDYDVNLYFVPMFTGASKAVSGKVVKKMQKNVDKKLQPYVLVYSGKIDDYKDYLDLSKKDTPYFFVLDKDGKIIYATSGEFSEDKLDQIEELVEE
ncbi:hypothetical protein RCC89_09780 [Cytophagaceae bacterium ABcell3]|nr:hypothetical protein RCC89_09780 [Cytophagaceae bacterium ABcell3]